MTRWCSVVSVVLALVLAPGAAAAQASADEEALLGLHETLIQAHVENRLDLWMALEAEEIVSVNGGTVSFPSAEERRAGRAAYLRDATFSEYRDVRPPIVRISDDGSLGWLIAEVRVTGELRAPDGTARPFDDVWAWIELYERRDGEWKLVGNASNNRRP